MTGIAGRTVRLTRLDDDGNPTGDTSTIEALDVTIDTVTDGDPDGDPGVLPFTGFTATTIRMCMSARELGRLAARLALLEPPEVALAGLARRTAEARTRCGVPAPPPAKIAYMRDLAPVLERIGYKDPWVLAGLFYEATRWP